jgi:predicted transcriptional regulator
MSTPDLKSELVHLIEQETDKKVLEAIFTILQKTNLDVNLKSKLSKRAMLSEADIQAGRLLTTEEVFKRTSR